MTITDVPLWVNASFGILFFIVNPLLFGHFFSRDMQAIDNALGLKIRNRIIFFVSMFLVAVAILSAKGAYSANVLPPRILLLGALPLAILWIGLSQTKLGKQVYASVTLESLISIHLFRFVGAYFFLAFAYGALPQQFAFIGGGGDILTALLIFLVLYSLKKKWKYALAAVFVWNVIGLLDILSVLTNAIYFTRIAMDGNGEGVIQFASFPFSWIPAFAPASIIFLHVLIFRKLIEMRKADKSLKSEQSDVS